MSEPKSFQVTIPWPGKSKARPKFNSNQQRAYMPKEYVEWKQAVSDFIQLQRLPTMVGTCSMVVQFHKDHIELMMAESDEERFGRSDIDNLLGGLMDALEDAGIYHNDIQVQRALVEIVKE